MNARAQPAANLAAERTILGALLKQESAIWKVNEILRPEHFTRSIHQRIYAAVRDLALEGKRPSLQTLVAKLGEEYDDGESTSFLLSAMRRDAEDSEEGSVWLDLVEVVVDFWRKRRLNELADWAKREAAKADSHGDDIMADLSARLEEIGANSSTQPIKWIGDIAARAVQRSSAAYERQELPGYDTGLPSLDEILGRIFPGDLGFVLAAPGDGKTVIGAQLARRAAERTMACYFQLEMQDEDMARRALAAESGLSVAEIEEGSFDLMAFEGLMAARDRLAGIRLAIDDRAKLRIEQIRDRCIAMKRAHGLGLIVVDHLRLVRTAAKVPNKFDRAEYVTGELKALAKELKIAVVCLSQVTRSSQRRDDPTPQRSDGDGGSSIEQDADWAIACLRRDRWLKTQRPRDEDSSEFADWQGRFARAKGKIELTILKRRRGEDGEMREFLFDGRASLLREIER